MVWPLDVQVHDVEVVAGIENPVPKAVYTRRDGQRDLVQKRSPLVGVDVLVDLERDLEQ